MPDLIHPQAHTNAEAARWFADVLDRWGISDPGDRAEWAVKELLAHGVRPVPTPPPARGPGSSDRARRLAKARIDAALAPCICGHPGLTYDGPDPVCLRHGRCAADGHPTEDVPGGDVACRCGAVAVSR